MGRGVTYLLLSPYPERIAPVLDAHGDDYAITTGPINVEYLEENDIELGVSFGYKHLIRPPELQHCSFINLHISFLPWNRGADPNLWSWVDGTPKGVTIHVVDEGLDTGPIIAQRQTAMGSDETLATSYDRLMDDMVALFAEVWSRVRIGEIRARPQHGQGTSHFVADRAKVAGLMRLGYDTHVAELRR